MAADTSRLDPFQKEFVKLLQANAYRHRPHEVFRDFCELGALSLSNAVDLAQYDRREARYLEIVKRYTAEEVGRFPAMLAAVVNSLECGFSDSLGQLFMALDLGNQWKGQFFTPYDVSLMMAKMTVGDIGAQVEQQGFITINEPAAGAGAMVIACAHAIQDQGINYQTAMHVTAQDVDATAVHMAYIQFSLLHIPAVVVHGNSLTVEEWEHWKTPAHILGFWGSKLARRCRPHQAAEAKPEAAQAPEMMDIRNPIIINRLPTAEQLALFA